MAKMKWYDWAAYCLLVIGGINWGLAIFGVNLVSLTIPWVWLQKVIYGVVGASGLYGIFILGKLAKH